MGYLSFSNAYLYCIFFNIYLLCFIIFKIISIKHMYLSYDYNHSYFFFYTSFLFLFSAFLSYFRNFFYSSIIIFLLFLTSISHWKYPNNLIIKRMDLFIVKIVAIFYFINSFYKNEFDRQFLSSLALSIIIFYFLEYLLDFYKNNQWVIFHMAIHIYASLLFMFFLFV